MPSVWKKRQTRREHEMLKVSRMTQYDLPESYRELQKLAGDIEGASGKGTKEEIIESIQEASEEEVKEAIEVPSDMEKEEVDNKEKEKSSESVESTSEVEETTEEEEADLTYSGSRDQSGDLFDREDAEEQLIDSENSSEEEELEDEETEEQEGQKPEEQEGDKVKAEVEPVELEADIVRYFHLGINQVLRKLFEKKGIQIEPLSERDLDHLETNTKIVAQEKLDNKQRRKIKERGGVIGMVLPHVKSALKGVVGGTDSTETDKEKQEESDEEVPEHLKNEKTPESQSTDARTDKPI